ncbi:MAG: REP-associated tyrosine transposase [Methylomicrobium sp.]
MTELDRYRIHGKTYFFTLALPEWPSRTAIHPIRGLCLELVKIKQQYPFNLDALVILPKYMQGLLTLPGDAEDTSLLWQQIKNEFIKLTDLSEGVQGDEESDFECKPFFGYVLRDGEDFARHLNFLHYNPVNQGLVQLVADWPYSTFFQYVQQGVYPLSWRMEGM